MPTGTPGRQTWVADAPCFMSTDPVRAWRLRDASSLRCPLDICREQTPTPASTDPEKETSHVLDVSPMARSAGLRVDHAGSVCVVSQGSRGEPRDPPAKASKGWSREDGRRSQAPGKRELGSAHRASLKSPTLKGVHGYLERAARTCAHNTATSRTRVASGASRTTLTRARTCAACSNSFAVPLAFVSLSFVVPAVVMSDVLFTAAAEAPVPARIGFAAERSGEPGERE